MMRLSPLARVVSRRSLMTFPALRQSNLPVDDKFRKIIEQEEERIRREAEVARGRGGSGPEPELGPGPGRGAGEERLARGGLEDLASEYVAANATSSSPPDAPFPSDGSTPSPPVLPSPRVKRDTPIPTDPTSVRKQLRDYKEKLAERFWTEWTRMGDSLSDAGNHISEVTGYSGIEKLRHSVEERENSLLRARDQAHNSKIEYSKAIEHRAQSQRQVNDLLTRKHEWQSEDVTRFTQLVQQDHANQKRESETKAAMDAADALVDNEFSQLMQAILERYHEEQVWSDKIRSMSTYGQLIMTGVNVIVFLMTILIFEPWKRQRLVQGVEERIADTLDYNKAELLDTIKQLDDKMSQILGEQKDLGQNQIDQTIELQSKTESDLQDEVWWIATVSTLALLTLVSLTR